MCDVVIAGIGQVPVGEHWGVPLRTLAARAMLAAQRDAGGLKPQALYVGNLLSPVVSHQSNLGTLLADNAGMSGIEAFTVEAAEASGAGALRAGYLAVLSGYVDVAMVVGVEKFTDAVGPVIEGAMSETMDYDFEATNGLTPTAAAAMVMRLYMQTYDLPSDGLAGFPVLAHENALNNPNAYFRRALTREGYARAAMLSTPLNLYDKAPYADGAAAVILTRPDRLKKALEHPLVQVRGSGAAIDTLALHDRHDPLAFHAAVVAIQNACRHAGILPADVQVFELSDNFSVYAALCLEAGGFAQRGAGWKLANGDELSLKGRLPVCTMGGMKARGNPAGASGVYQVVEACLQLRGEAGANQVRDARRALTLCLGGPASTAVCHVLQTWQ
ncbi:MAG: thiolase domain-containing protein [Anaerolineae bacterium]|nr:thiolase domain-containing protein [Anaerolineae bacterium]